MPATSSPESVRPSIAASMRVSAPAWPTAKVQTAEPSTGMFMAPVPS